MNNWPKIVNRKAGGAKSLQSKLDVEALLVMVEGCRQLLKNLCVQRKNARLGSRIG